MDRPHFPAKEQFTRDEWREMAAALNAELKGERSRISTRARQRLDEIADAKQQQRVPDLVLRHPRYIQIVEEAAGKLFLGVEEIHYGDLLDRSMREAFEYKYFYPEKLNEEIKDFCFMLKVFDALEADAPGSIGTGAGAESQEASCAQTEAREQSLSEWIVRHLSGVYGRVFSLAPYLGGVGTNEKHRQPNSPFGVFVKFVLDGLGIRTRNGLLYSPATIKNCMPPSNIKAARLPDESELIAARDELVPKRGRGRPSKEPRTVADLAHELAGPATSNGAPDTN